MKQARAGWYAFGLAASTGAALRFWSPGRIALWRDEAQFVNIASLPDLSSITSFLYAHESHPPLFYWLGHLVGSMSGGVAQASSWMVLFFSLAAIPLAAWLAGTTSHRAGAWSGALVALSVPLVLLGVQIRPYALLGVLLLLSTGALVRGLADLRMRWKGMWLLASLSGAYVHHVGLLAVGSEILVCGWLLLRGQLSWSRLRGWAVTLGLFGILIVPDFVMAFHQARVAEAAASNLDVMGPWGRLADLFVVFPVELLVPALLSLAMVCIPLPRDANRVPRRRMPSPGTLLGSLFLAMLLVLTVGAYRSAFLQGQLVLMMGPLGVAVAVVITETLWQWHWRRLAFAGALSLLAGTALGFVNWHGFGKTDTDLAAGYLAAEARRADLIVIAPGPLGTSFNRYYHGSAAQVDFPFQGALSLFPFDHHFERLTNLTAVGQLRAVIDSAFASRRRVWMVMPFKYLTSEIQPVAPESLAALGLDGVEVSRANLVRQIVLSRYGTPSHAVRSVFDPRDIECLSVELFTPSNRQPGSYRDP
jgi:hypothetical protein